MKVYRDAQIKNFNLFLLFFSLLLFLTGIVFCASQMITAKSMFISHDEAIVSSLLKQGVSKTVIATAITNKESSKAGVDFLTMIGLTKHSAVKFMPFLLQFQRKTGYSILSIMLLLSLLLLGASFLFFRKRERLYQQAENTIRNYINGDFSDHLPQTNEGTIYQIFASIEQLATMLQSRNETEQNAKEFLKNTISDISHQLKTPLAALSMYQEIMANEPEHPDTIREFSEKAGLSLKRMELLIQSMLKITRLDAGSIIFEKNKCKVSELIQYSLTELMTRAKKEKKEIILSPSCTDTSIDETLICDREWTSEAIENIIKNALDHTDSEDVIRISWEHAPTMVRIIISDTGTGIAPEDIHHIFKRFYRSQKSLDTQGAGLGLSLSRSIMEGQGGEISVQSIQGEGTTFMLSFPTP